MPTQLMQHLHMGPEDAIKAHIDLGSPTLSVGIHWGTFMMSDEHYLAPRQVLEQVWTKYFPPAAAVEEKTIEEAQESVEAEEEEEEELQSIASSSSSTTLIVTNTAVNTSSIVNHSTKFITIPFGQTITLL